MLSRFFAVFLMAITLISCTITEEVIVGELGNIDYIQKIDVPQLATFMQSATEEQKIDFNQISNEHLEYIDFINVLTSFTNQNASINIENYNRYKKELDALKFLTFRIDLRDKLGFEVIHSVKSTEEFNANNIIIENVFDLIKQNEDKRIAHLLRLNPTTLIGNIKKSETVFSDNPLANFTSTNYEFDGQCFSKSINLEKYLKGINLEYNDDDDDETAVIKSMMRNLKFKTKYTFHKKIKALDDDNVSLAPDKKSFVKEYTLRDLLKDPNIAEFKVTLEN